MDQCRAKRRKPSQQKTSQAMSHQGRVIWASASGLWVRWCSGQLGSGQWASLQTSSSGPCREKTQWKRWSQTWRCRWQRPQQGCSTSRMRRVKTVSAGQEKRIGRPPATGWVPRGSLCAHRFSGLAFYRVVVFLCEALLVGLGGDLEDEVADLELVVAEEGGV